MLESTKVLKYLRKKLLYENHSQHWGEDQIYGQKHNALGTFRHSSIPSPNLCLSIRDMMLEQISNDVMNSSGEILTLASRIKKEQNLKEMSKKDEFKKVAGADAGSQVLPLASKRYAVISAIICPLPSGSRRFLPPESFSFPYSMTTENFNGIVTVNREAKLYETASAFIEEKSGVRLVLVDGPLAFSNRWRNAGRRRDRRRLIEAVNEFLHFCKDEELVVAGVVKRPSARYLIYHLGLHDETDLCDSFLLLHALKPGERTEVFSPEATLKKMKRAAIFMETFDDPIFSFYARFSQQWSIPPLRIDVPSFSLNYLNEIANYCYASSLWNGVPLPIVRADEEVRISKRFMAEIYNEIVSYVGRSNEVSYLAPQWGEGKWMETRF